jgi:tetratricopeptide (TPR) repeat protein
MRAAAALLLLFLRFADLYAADFSADGLKALEEKRYDAAVQAFTQAIAADPKDYSAHFNLALAYGFLNKDAEGVAEYRKTLELRPGLFEAEVNEGILLLRRKNAADALPLFEDAAAQKPKEFRPRYYLAQCQLDIGAPAKADESYRLALELDPKSAAAELGLAHALAGQDKIADSVPHFRQAAQLDASYRDHLLELADLYEKHNQPDEALAVYREFPGNVAVQEHIGDLMMRSQRYAEAIPPLEQANAKDPTPANRLALAMAYVFNKQVDKGLPLFDKAAEADPANYDIRMMYARALRDVKQYPASAKQFAEAVKLKPNEAGAWSDLGSVAYLAGDFDQSLQAFEHAHQLGEDTPGNWFIRAIILDKQKQLKPALAAYQKFLSMSHGEHPDQEFQARQRSKNIQNELERR